MTALFAVGVFAIAYALIASERISRVAVALGGAAAMVLIGATNPEHMFYSEEFGVDWNVIFLLFGMMIIVGFIHKTGVFEFLAVAAIRWAGGRPKRSLAMLVLITAIASALLDNVTTILLVVPMTLVIAHHLRVSPMPFLLSEVFASNIGGAATLVGDPPNIIIASRAGLSFNDFLVNMLPLTVVVIAITIPMLQFMFRRELVNTKADRAAIAELRPRKYIKDRPLLIKSGTVLTGVLIGFMTHSWTHLEPSVVALLGAGVLAAIGGAKPSEYLRDIEWGTLLFFMGLFIMVGSLGQVGALESLAIFLKGQLGGDASVATLGIVSVSAFLSAIVDNIPYVVSMSPVIADLASSVSGGDPNGLWWALAIGADFGGNATIIGASANVIAVGLAAKAGHAISFWRFLRYGLPVTAMSVVIGLVYVAVRYI
jgi:Na+/H+ antiporter NhaD/arsenite permease-like protein